METLFELYKILPTILSVFFIIFRKAADVGERILRSTPDWGETAVNGDHLWAPTSVSGDFCYAGDTECCVSANNSFFKFNLELSTVSLRSSRI